MLARQIVLALTTLALMTGFLVTLDRGAATAPPPPQSRLDNVRAHLPAQIVGGPEYVVDGGRLLIGRPGHWVAIPTPPDVIVAAVEVIPLTAPSGDPAGEILYIGAANRLAVYTSRDRGQSWQAGTLTHPRVHAHVHGGVTALALDPVQQLLYVGTDQAGLFRVRITPAGLVSSAQLLLPDPVRQVAVDRLGRGLALIRTERALYYSSEHGLRWLLVNTLPAAPTALAWVQGETPRILAGTTTHGLWHSVDGLVWEALDAGLGEGIAVDALAADPLRPQTVYAALHPLRDPASARVLVSEDGGATWLPLRGDPPAGITDLLPVSIRRGAVYALTATDRTPYPLGNAPAQPAATPQNVSARPVSPWLGWVAAGLAATALAFALIVDLVERRRRFPADEPAPLPVRLPSDRHLR